MQKFVTTGIHQNPARSSKTGGRRHSDVLKQGSKRRSSRRSVSKDSDDNNNSQNAKVVEEQLENGGYEVARYPGPPPLPPPNSTQLHNKPDSQHHRQQVDPDQPSFPSDNSHVLKISVVEQSEDSPGSPESEPPPAPPRIQSYDPDRSREKIPREMDDEPKPSSSRMFDLTEHEAMKRTLEENYAQDKFGRNPEPIRSSLRNGGPPGVGVGSSNHRTAVFPSTNHRPAFSRAANQPSEPSELMKQKIFNSELNNARLLSSEIANQRAISSGIASQQLAAAELANQRATETSVSNRMGPVQNSESDSQIVEKLKQETGAKVRVVELRAESINNLDSNGHGLHSSRGTSIATVHARPSAETRDPADLRPLPSTSHDNITTNATTRHYYRDEPSGRLENIPQSSRKSIPKNGQHHFHQHSSQPLRYSEATTSGYEKAYLADAGQINSIQVDNRPTPVHNFHKHGRNEGIPSRESTENYSWTTGGSQQTFPVSDVESHGQRMRRTRSGDILTERMKNPERSKFDDRFMKKSASARYHPNTRIVMVPPSGRRHHAHKRPRARTGRSGKRQQKSRHFWDFSTHKWILMGVVGAFLIWAAIFFPILMAANEHDDLN